MSEKFDVWKYYDEWEGWTCKKCGKLFESTERILINHSKTCKGEDIKIIENEGGDREFL